MKWLVIAILILTLQLQTASVSLNIDSVSDPRNATDVLICMTLENFWAKMLIISPKTDYLPLGTTSQLWIPLLLPNEEKHWMSLICIYATSQCFWLASFVWWTERLYVQVLFFTWARKSWGGSTEIVPWGKHVSKNLQKFDKLTGTGGVNLPSSHKVPPGCSWGWGKVSLNFATPRETNYKPSE